MYQIFRALGDLTRLRIFHLLVNFPAMAVKDLEMVLQVGQVNISRHLSTLKSHQLVKVRREGNLHIYSLSHEVPEEVKQLVRRYGNESIQLQFDLKKAHEYFQ